MNTKYPIVNIRVSGGQYELEGEYDEFLTLRGVVNHDINIGQTKLEYILETGMTLGTVPFPLLEVHRTDLSLGYALYSFNMMREMEFASDRFAAITAQYHLNSLIFNRVPMIKQLGFREVVSAKVLWSHLDDKHSQLIDYPFKFYQANRLPYVEVSTGVENVFQYFRFDVVWRLTHNQNPNTYPVGIRARFDVNF